MLEEGNNTFFFSYTLMVISIIDNLLINHYGFEKFILVTGNKCDDDSRIIIKAYNRIFYLYKVDNLKEIEKCYEMSYGIDYYYPFVVNFAGEYISEFNNAFYILLYDTCEAFHYQYLFYFYRTATTNNLKVLLEWRNSWINRCDYIESFYPSIKGKYPLIDESIHYYIGLMEMAIFQLKDYSQYYDYNYVQHRIFSFSDYFNPLNLKPDFKERDFSEYLKFVFFQNSYEEKDIRRLIFLGKDTFNYDLVLARLLFPNYYFNLVDDIILGKKSQESLKNIISRSQEYVEYLKMIVTEIEKFYPIKKISF